MNNGFNNAPERPQRGHRAPPCAMVIFGASGDLTRRLLMPALYNLVRARRIPNHFAIIGVDRSDWSEDRFRVLSGRRRAQLYFGYGDRIGFRAVRPG